MGERERGKQQQPQQQNLCHRNNMFVHVHLSSFIVCLSVVGIGMLKCPFPPVEETNSINKNLQEEKLVRFPRRLTVAVVVLMESEQKSRALALTHTRTHKHTRSDKMTINFEIYGQ